jgi:hypothetical protein
VRLAGKNIARLVVEDETAVLYHCMHNDRETHASGICEEGLVCLCKIYLVHIMFVPTHGAEQLTALVAQHWMSNLLEV